MFQLPVLYLKLSRPFFNIPKLAKLKKDGLPCTQADKLIVICRWNCPLIDSFSHVGQIRELGSTPNSFAIQTHSAAQQPRRTLVWEEHCNLDVSTPNWAICRITLGPQLTASFRRISSFSQTGTAWQIELKINITTSPLSTISIQFLIQSKESFSGTDPISRIPT